jgi:drug/metabolite transporter (DMT)-like permease
MTRLAPLALLAITAIWGWTFVLVKEGMSLVGPFTFLAARFILAFLLLCLLFYPSLRRMSRKSRCSGILIGVALFSGYLFQTWGLVYTSATKSGLITGLTVIMVPIASSLTRKERIHVTVWLGVILALTGLVLLVLGKGDLITINIGDLLTLFCAVGFALHIILVDRSVRSVDYRQLLVVQVGTVALLSLIGAVLLEKLPCAYPPSLIRGILITGLAATALALYVLNRFQAYSTASYTAVILTMEPVFAGLFGFLLLNESLRTPQILGGVLILSGIALPQIAKWKAGRCKAQAQSDH